MAMDNQSEGPTMADSQEAHPFNMPAEIGDQIFGQLSRKTQKMLALVCKSWNRTSAPFINRVIDFSFGIGSHKRNADLLGRLTRECALSTQVQEILISGWLSISGVERKGWPEQSDLDGNDTKQRSQLRKLTTLLPTLQVRTVTWRGNPIVPVELLVAMVKLPWVQFEYISQDTVPSLSSTPCTTPRARLRVLQSLGATRNLTIMSFAVPVGPDHHQLIELLGKVIRSNPGLRSLSLDAFTSNGWSLRKCPWFMSSDTPPFPPICQLQLSGFRIDTNSEQDKKNWSRLIQWSEIDDFSTTDNMFFALYHMPKVRTLELMGSILRKPQSKHVYVKETLQYFLRTCQPLDSLSLVDANDLLDKAVWDRHKGTLRSLCARIQTAEVIPLSRDVISDMASLPQLTRVTIEVLTEQTSVFPATWETEPARVSAVTAFSKIEPFSTIHQSIKSLIWVQRLRLNGLKMRVNEVFKFCVQIWYFVMNAICEAGIEKFGPEFRPRLETLEIGASCRGFGSVLLFVTHSDKELRQGPPVVQCYQLDFLREYQAEYGLEIGVIGLNKALQKWEAFDRSGWVPMEHNCAR